MIIIGEKLNGAIPACAKAIADRDAAYIKDMAKKQADAGADYIDCCAAVAQGELEILKWMLECIQSATDCPISIDSPDASVLVAAMPYCQRPGLFNSVSCEGDKITIAFPVLAKPENAGWSVMALLCDDTGIPKTPEKRIEVFGRIMDKAREHGIAEGRLHIDPLIEMLCTADDGAGILTVFEVMRRIRQSHPSIHISGGLSNVSYHLPARRLVNQAFAALAISAGMDSAVTDPLSPDLRGVIYATEAMLGYDDLCSEFTAAYRKGVFGAK
jgi:5-methyltetrahydrofolate--homocysteine methyltransferase